MQFRATLRQLDNHRIPAAFTRSPGRLGGRIHPPFSAPRAAFWLCPHPPLWIPGQPQTEGKSGVVPLLLTPGQTVTEPDSGPSSDCDSTTVELFHQCPACKNREDNLHPNPHDCAPANGCGRRSRRWQRPPSEIGKNGENRSPPDVAADPLFGAARWTHIGRRVLSRPDLHLRLQIFRL